MKAGWEGGAPLVVSRIEECFLGFEGQKRERNKLGRKGTAQNEKEGGREETVRGRREDEEGGRGCGERSTKNCQGIRANIAHYALVMQVSDKYRLSIVA